MYRFTISQITRTSAQPTAVAFAKNTGIRTYTTVPPPSDQSAPNPQGKKGGKNTALYTILGFAAAGTAYYYYTQQPEQADRLRGEAKADGERLKSKAQEAADAAKGTSDQARKGYEQLKAGGKDRLESLKGTADREVRTSGRSIGEDLEAKYESAKGATRGTLNRAGDSTENLYREAEQKAQAAREDVERRAHEVKQGWFSWLGWGQGKIDGTKETAASEADLIKREGAKRVASAADDVKTHSEKHT